MMKTEYGINMTSLTNWISWILNLYDVIILYLFNNIKCKKFNYSSLEGRYNIALLLPR